MFPFDLTRYYQGAFNLVGRSGTNIAELDDKTGYLVTMASEHHKIHEGQSYVHSSVQPSSAAAMYWVMVNPQSTLEHHTRDFISCTSAGKMTIYSDANCGTFDKGTLCPGVNLNRKNAGTSGLLVYEIPLGLTGTGNVLYNGRVGAGGPQKIGGSVRSEDEMILKNNGTYVLEFTPDAASINGLKILDYTL